MANTIILKKSSTASAVPGAGSLQPGELAVNLADAKLYTKTTGGTVILVGSGAAGGGAGTVTSVDVSGGTTGLTTSGGPVTSSGTITLAGTLGVANGGTGATTLTSGYLVKGNGTSAVSASVVYDTGTNVGIGATTTNGKLTIKNPSASGDQVILNVQGASNTQSIGRISYNQTDDTMRLFNESTFAGSGLLFGTSNTERMRIDSSGLVGIGTSSPGVPFQVSKTGVDSGVGFYTISKFLDGSSNKGLQIGYDNAAQTAILVSNTTSASSNMAFWTYEAGVSGWAERMRITAAGNVGIGTSAPGAKLDVNGGSANTEVRFNHADNVVGRTVTLRMSSTQNASYTGAGAYMQAIQGAGVDVYSLAFGTTQGSTSASERMRIDSSGNVGIGTSSPLARLNVSGGATRLQYNVADDNPLIVYNTSSTGYGPYIQAGVGVRYALHVTDYTGTSRMLIQGSGNVGIGTSAPESLLELSADLGPTINLRRSGSTNGNGVIRSIGSSGTVNSAIEFGGGLSNIMGFSTNGSERMRITSTGAVGINTSTPATTLEVYGGLIAGSENRQTHPNASGAGGFKAQWNFSGGSAETDLYNLFSGAVSSFRFYQSTGSGTAQLLYNMQPNSHEFYISGGEQMRLDSSGNLLVGTTTAVEKVTIGSGSATAAGINLRTTQTDFIIQPSNTAAGGVTIGTSWVSGGQGPLIFTTSAGEILRFNNGSIVSPSLADAVGYKGLPQNSQTASYTLALTDMGKMVNTTTGGVIIPANSSVAFPIGSTVVVYNNSASSQTISITTDTIYLAGTATTGSRTLAQRGLATCVKVASTTWVVSGNVT